MCKVEYIGSSFIANKKTLQYSLSNEYFNVSDIFESEYDNNEYSFTVSRIF